MNLKTLADLMCEAFVAGFESSNDDMNGANAKEVYAAHIVEVAPKKVGELIVAAIGAGKL